MPDPEHWSIVFPDCPSLRAGDTVRVTTTETYPATGAPPIPRIVSASVVTATGGEYPIRAAVQRMSGHPGAVTRAGY